MFLTDISTGFPVKPSFEASVWVSMHFSLLNFGLVSACGGYQTDHTLHSERTYTQHSERTCTLQSEPQTLKLKPETVAGTRVTAAARRPRSTTSPRLSAAKNCNPFPLQS